MMGRTMLVRDCPRGDLFSASGHRDLGKNGIKARSAPNPKCRILLVPRSVNDQPRYFFKLLRESTTHIEGEP
jgi:hypothetical protein